jgi:hypothetical protein
MSHSFVEKLMLIVVTVLWARASELDFPRRPATGCSKPRDGDGSP